MRGGWLEATPASSLPATWLEAGVEVEIATCKVAGAHHLQAELIVAGQALHSQQILKCKHLIENLSYCDRVTLKMMNIVPPLNIQKKDIRLKKKTLKEPFFIKKKVFFVLTESPLVLGEGSEDEIPHFHLFLRNSASSFHWLSSSIFTYCSFVPHR